MDFLQEIKNMPGYISDFTYLAFYHWIMYVLPESLEKYIPKDMATFEVAFDFTEYNNSISGKPVSELVINNDETYSDVYMDEYKLYLLNMPGIVEKRIYDNGRIIISFDTKIVCNYYYEEMQRIEYQNDLMR